MMSDRPEDRTHAVLPPPTAPDPLQVGNTVYAWQMQVDDQWNIIGFGTQTGQVLPLVTTNMAMAWEAAEVAQAHANRHSCQVRLAAFSFGALMALVEPNE